MHEGFNLFDAVADVPIEYAIGRDIPLRKRGTSYVGTCPFHSHAGSAKRSSSFSVKPKGFGRYDKGRFTCFACGAKGDAVDYFCQRYCQRQFEIVRKRRRNFVVFRWGNKIKRFPAGKGY